MKTFKQYLREENSNIKPEPKNSRGVLIHGNKIFVGVSHGQTPTFDNKTFNMIHQHMIKHGHWMEGNRGDEPILKPITGNLKALGSFDEDLINKDLYTDKDGNRFTPYYHMSSLFGNLPNSEQEDGIIKTLTNEKSTIRDTLINNHHKIFKTPTKPHIVDKFLSHAGDSYIKSANQPATEQNVRNFIKTGVKDSWEGNTNPNNGVGNMAQQTQNERENYLLNRAPNGVYYVGSGHIPTMAKTLEQSKVGYQLIGGKRASL